MKNLILSFMIAVSVLANEVDVKDPKDSIYEVVDMSMIGNFFETKLTVSEEKFYRFGFVYAQDRDIQAKEHKDGEANFPGYTSDKFDQWLCTKYSIDKLAGMYARNIDDNSYVPTGKTDEDKKVCTGAKIMLKLVITPIKKPAKNSDTEWEYARGDDVNFANYIIQKASDINEDFDLSTYGNDSTFQAPNGSMARSKRLITIKLAKGEYNVKIEALNDTPELKDIITYLEIREHIGGK